MNPSKDPSRRSPVLGINRRNLDFVFKNYFPGRFRKLDDKLSTKGLLERAGVPCPMTLAVIRDRADVAKLEDILKNLDSVVVKPAGGSGGDGILVLNRRGNQWLRLNGEALSREGIRNHVEQILTGTFSMDESKDVAILEERIHAHPFFLDLFPEGLADIRIVMHRGTPVQAMCRLPSSASEGKANLHSGGIGLGIDIGTGRTLGGVCEGRTVEVHPDSRVPVAGLTIPEWKACLDTALEASRVVDVEYLGVDIVLDRDRGPVVLELNARPGLDIQIANRDGQPVEPAAPSSFLERFTWLVSWILLAALALSPLVYSRWRSEKRGDIPIAVASASNGVVPGDAEQTAAYHGINWEDEEVPLSSLHAEFREARALAAKGDTAAAIRAYQAASADSSVAPFALNNIALIHRRRGKHDLAEKTLREAIGRFPDYGRGHYNLGLILLDGGKRDEALVEFRASLEIDGSHPRSWAKMAEIQLELGEPETAAASFGKAVRFAPASSVYRFGLGQAYRALRRFDLAAQCFDQALSLDPDNEEATYWRVRSRIDATYESGEAPSNAELEALSKEVRSCVGDKNGLDGCRSLLAELDWDRGRFSQALKLHEEMVVRSVSPAFHRRAGAVAALEIGLWERAEALLNGLSSKQEPELGWLEVCRIGRYLNAEGLGTTGTGIEVEDSDDPIRNAIRLLLASDEAGANRERQEVVRDPQIPLAELLLSPGSVRELIGEDNIETWLTEHVPARSRFRARLEENALPGSLVLWALFQNAREAGEGSLASATLSVLENRDPEFRPVLFHRFEEAMAGGRTKTATGLGERLLSLTPDDPKLLVGLATLWVNSGSVKKSREYLNRLGSSDRGQIPAKVVEGRILLGEGRRGDAVRLLRDLTQKSPSDIDARLALADAYLASGRRKGEIKDLRMATAGAPARMDIRRRLARELMTVRRYEEGAVEWGQLLKLNPEDLSCRFNLALCLQRDDNLKEAVLEYERVLSRAPDHTKAWFNRSLALEDMGRLVEAQEGYRRVLDLDPTHEKSREKLSNIEGVQ